MKFRQITFFRALLLLPLLLPVSALFFGINAAIAVLVLSVRIGGLAYLAFGCLVFFGLGRIRSESQLHKLIWLSPILYMPILIVGWFAQVLIGRMKTPGLQMSAADVLPLVVYGLLLGYLYVVVAELLFAIFKNYGWVDKSWPASPDAR